MIAELALCLVVAVTDGDTLKVRCGDPGAYEQVTIRLAEIDAPERAQAFGQRSKSALSELCFGEVAGIKPVTLDRYGRTVGHVRCKDQDASAEQVRRGMAWAYTKYLTDPAIKPLENAARAGRAGLWADPDPVAPWLWRKARKQVAK